MSAGRQAMAKDVERALLDVIAAHGVRTPDQAAAFLADLKQNGRYHTDASMTNALRYRAFRARSLETICLPGHISFAASRMWENIDRKRLDGLQPVIVLQANIIDLMSWSGIREGRGWEIIRPMDQAVSVQSSRRVVQYDSVQCPTSADVLLNVGSNRTYARCVSLVSGSPKSILPENWNASVLPAIGDSVSETGASRK